MLGLTLREPAIFVLSKFGGLPWRVGHYNWWLNPPIVRPDPILEPDAFDENAPMGVVLVQAESGIVKAVRSVRPPEDFARLLLCQVGRQILSRFDPWHYLDVVEAAVRAQSEGDVLVREAMFMGECGWEPAAHGQMASPFRAQGTA